jgi:hypothetical protein
LVTRENQGLDRSFLPCFEPLARRPHLSFRLLALAWKRLGSLPSTLFSASWALLGRGIGVSSYHSRVSGPNRSLENLCPAELFPCFSLIRPKRHAGDSNEVLEVDATMTMPGKQYGFLEIGRQVDQGMNEHQPHARRVRCRTWARATHRAVGRAGPAKAPPSSAFWNPTASPRGTCMKGTCMVSSSSLMWRPPFT